MGLQDYERPLGGNWISNPPVLEKASVDSACSWKALNSDRFFPPWRSCLIVPIFRTTARLSQRRPHIPQYSWRGNTPPKPRSPNKKHSLRKQFRNSLCKLSLFLRFKISRKQPERERVCANCLCKLFLLWVAVFLGGLPSLEIWVSGVSTRRDCVR